MSAVLRSGLLGHEGDELLVCAAAVVYLSLRRRRDDKHEENHREIVEIVVGNRSRSVNNLFFSITTQLVVFSIGYKTRISPSPPPPLSLRSLLFLFFNSSQSENS